ncbi:hypothetical protein T01_14444 [Trichinella spiralis]|uniref:Uncharacterized protein n=1 Tax=Trichinella spiralis TaxID=6334 RepID=A0A0V0ZH48_TRISP|nr:hypothetical protein T01_14444 [Trichinella spiralis]
MTFDYINAATNMLMQRESNPMSSARQAIWLTTVLHALGSYLIFSWGSENRTL